MTKITSRFEYKEQTLKQNMMNIKTQTLIKEFHVLQKKLDEIKKAIEQNSTAFTNKEIEIKAVVYDEKIIKQNLMSLHFKNKKMN